MSNHNELLNNAAFSRVLPELVGVFAGAAMFTKDWSADNMDLKTALALVIGLFSAGSRFYDGPSRHPVIDVGLSLMTGISVTVGLNILDTLANGEQIRAIPGWMVVGALGLMITEVGMTVKRFVGERRRAEYWENKYVGIDAQLAAEEQLVENYRRKKTQEVADTKNSRMRREGKGIVVSTATPHDGVRSNLPDWVKKIMRRVDERGSKEDVVAGNHRLVLTDNGPRSVLSSSIADGKHGFTTGIYQSPGVLMMRVKDPRTGRSVDAFLPPNLDRDVQHKLIMNIALLFRHDRTTAMDRVTALINELYTMDQSDFKPEVFDEND